MATIPLTTPDLVCDDDLDPNAGEVANDLQALEQDVLHMLLERPGENIDDLSRGVGLVGMLSGTTADLAKVPARVEAGLLKDDRVTSCRTVISSPSGGAYRIDITIETPAGVLGLAYSYDAVGGLRSA